MGFDFWVQDKKKVIADLKEHYKNLGFVIFHRLEYMILDLGLNHSNLKDIGLVIL
jgi:hypothetical protein